MINQSMISERGLVQSWELQDPELIPEVSDYESGPSTGRRFNEPGILRIQKSGCVPGNLDPVQEIWVSLGIQGIWVDSGSAVGWPLRIQRSWIHGIRAGTWVLKESRLGVE